MTTPTTPDACLRFTVRVKEGASKQYLQNMLGKKKTAFHISSDFHYENDIFRLRILRHLQWNLGTQRSNRSHVYFNYQPSHGGRQIKCRYFENGSDVHRTWQWHPLSHGLPLSLTTHAIRHRWCISHRPGKRVDHVLLQHPITFSTPP